MAGISFDDLIPKQSQGAQKPRQALSFDDLIPQQQEAPKQQPTGVSGAGAGLMGYADTASFGFADELTGAIGGVVEGLGRPEGFQGAYQRVRDNTRRLQQQVGQENPVAYTAGQIGGGLATGLIPGGAAAKGAGLAGKAARGAAAGAAVGGAYGFGSGDGDLNQRVNKAAKDAALGATVGAGGALVARGAGRIVEGLSRSKLMNAVPSVTNIKAKANKLYDATKKSGVYVDRDAFGQFQSKASQDLLDAGFDPELHPKLAVVMRKMENITQGNPSLADIEKMRRLLRSPLSSIDRDEQRVARVAQNAFDDFVDSLDPQQVVGGGDPQIAAKMLSEARKTWSQVRKVESLEQVMDKAKRRAAKTGSGANIDNVIRQEFDAILNSPKRLRGFSKEERQAMRAIVEGSSGGNAARLIGKMAPTGIVSGGIGSGAGATIGGAIAGPVGAGIGGAAVPFAGAIAKNMADKSTSRAAENLLMRVRNGGPLNVKNTAQLEQLIRRLVAAQTPVAIPAGQ